MAANASKKKEVDSATCVPEQFPVGLKVLVVDDDVICLKILEQMLRKCMYSVTTCSQATAALSLLREKKGFFDIVLSDVHMPDMDGFKLLEFVGLEMDLPVIMMSGDDRTSNVMRGIRHGACDYLIKPIRTEELQNIWQHIVRKKRNVSKGHDGNLEHDEEEDTCSLNEGSIEAVVKTNKKRKDIKEEEEEEEEDDDHTMSKKQRVVWSIELHQQFVSAVNHLGIDKAVPKRILEVMNVPGLSRENVASHLQKFRLYLKRLSGVCHQQDGLQNHFGGPLDQNPKLGTFGGLDYQTLASSGRISPEIMAALHAEFLNSPNSIPGLPLVDQARNRTVGLIQHHQGEQIIGNRVMSLKQHQQPQDSYPNQFMFPEQTRLINNIQPSCIFPSHQYNVLSPQSNNPSFVDPEVSFCAYGGPRSVNANNNGVTLAAHNSIGTYAEPFSAFLPNNNTIVCGSYDDNGLPMNTSAFLGRGTIIPNRFAVDDTELPTIMGNANQGRIW